MALWQPKLRMEDGGRRTAGTDGRIGFVPPRPPDGPNWLRSAATAQPRDGAPPVGRNETRGDLAAHFTRPPRRDEPNRRGKSPGETKPTGSRVERKRGRGSGTGGARVMVPSRSRPAGRGRARELHPIGSPRRVAFEHTKWGDGPKAASDQVGRGLRLTVEADPQAGRQPFDDPYRLDADPYHLAD